MTPEEGKSWRALHEHMEKVLEDQLLSLGWQYGPGEGLLAGIQWMGDRIRELEAKKPPAKARG